MNGELTEADDRFHPGTTEDRTWTETAWFAAAVPERGMGIWTYPLFRPELGIMSCGIYVWEHGHDELWQLPYYRTWWHLPIPPDIEATSFTLPNGLSYECLQPLTEYRITYSDGDEMSLEMIFEALHPAHAVGVVPGSHGHLDQLGHVTGELSLGSERIEIDCLEMRDRTWSPRRESRQANYLTYSYGAASQTSAFHVATRLDKSGQPKLLTGFVLREGSTVALAAGECEVSRDGQGRPTSIELTCTCEDGSELHAHGEVLGRMAQPSTPWFVWVCITRWTFPDGSQATGEHQDTWSPALLRRFLRQHHA